MLVIFDTGCVVKCWAPKKNRAWSSNRSSTNTNKNWSYVTTSRVSFQTRKKHPSSNPRGFYINISCFFNSWAVCFFSRNFRHVLAPVFSLAGIVWSVPYSVQRWETPKSRVFSVMVNRLVQQSHDGFMMAKQLQVETTHVGSYSHNHKWDDGIFTLTWMVDFV